MRRQIIALGGGGFLMEPDNQLLDKYIIEQSPRRRPKICFIGAASGDSESYTMRFYNSFQTLNCIPTHLSLFRLPTKDLEAFILDQDIVYVGGGNTRSLIALLKEWELDVYLRAAWEQGVILSGVSAGSLCWFEEGLSDYFPGELNRVKCLGFLKGSNCPHYDGEVNRRPVYHRMILSGAINNGIAAEDGVALHYIDSGLGHVVTSRPNGKAYYVRKRKGRIEEVIIPAIFLGDVTQARRNVRGGCGANIRKRMNNQ